ncbi:helix-turn-helix domain-containing protein [Leptolyngbya cf. ectocarpi LEGE 11479]|uniref:Helix-turn-helix domain-containing protein n=1 Tax=Leptolyngbya cf. ectocarpi LEGE 11479 TaxID=1828722 RepID=A0A928WYF5_LEPEC|nr:helix-turn-helix transcriptional regulator [Leptolyngbya ectocarpi]MBE9065147.1 helix-turn-helix domain-containing protein [Leptolyngbya cf. ectocarpi LEGE 11479]
MDDVEVENKVVLKQLREALGLSQEALSRVIDCSIRKVQRGENGAEPGWTIKEAKNIDRLLSEHFGVGISALPDRLSSSEPVPFLADAISQKNVEA